MSELPVLVGRVCHPTLAGLLFLAVSLLVAALLRGLAPTAVSGEVAHAWGRAAGWCAGLALLVGFAGTVSGLTAALARLPDGTDIDMGALGGDLSLALTTTGAGIVVAIVASLAELLLPATESAS